MGVVGSYVSTNSVFWLTALLGLPALLALSAIGSEQAPAAHGAPLRAKRHSRAGLG
jgi:hypothetical protein